MKFPFFLLLHLFDLHHTPAPSLPPMTDVLQTVPDEHLRAFHHMERNLFQRFISELSIPPSEAMDIIFLWLMLERTTGSSFICHLLRLDGPSLLPVIEEARICMAVVLHGPANMPAAFSDQSIVITKSALGGKLTLARLYQMRERILRGMHRSVETIAPRIFGDIVARVTGSNEAAARVGDRANYAGSNEVADAPTMADQTSTFGARRPAVSPIIVPTPVPVQAFQMPVRDLAYQPAVGMMEPPFAPSDDSYYMPVHAAHGDARFGGIGGFPGAFAVAQPSLNPAAPPWTSEDLFFSREERTLYLTFSRGYFIPAERLIAFFTEHFGDCIQDLYYEETANEKHPLYARMTILTMDTVWSILRGKTSMKYTVNGRHVLARLFKPKITDGRLTSSSDVGASSSRSNIVGKYSSDEKVED